MQQRSLETVSRGRGGHWMRSGCLIVGLGASLGCLGQVNGDPTEFSNGDDDIGETGGDDEHRTDSDGTDDAPVPGDPGSGEPPPPDPCIAAGDCPAGVWIDVTPQAVKELGPEFGPGPVVQDPARPNNLYFAGSDAGVWKSTDYGNHWTLLNDEIGALAIGMVMAVAGTTPATLWVAQWPVVLYKSTDDGVTWRRLEFNLPGDESFYSIVVDPYDSQHLLSGMHHKDGIFESEDGGESWELVGGTGFPSGGDSWYAFFIDTGVAATTRDNWIAIANAASVAVTRDGGATWKIPTGISGLMHGHGNAQIYQKGATLFVPGLYGPGHGIYRSTDWGDSFARVHDGTFSVTWGTDEKLYSTHAWACGGCDFGGLGLFTSNAAGDTWTAVPGEAHPNIGPQNIVVTSDGDHQIFIGTFWHEGIWRYVVP